MFELAGRQVGSRAASAQRDPAEDPPNREAASSRLCAMTLHARSRSLFRGALRPKVKKSLCNRRQPASQ